MATGYRTVIEISSRFIKGARSRCSAGSSSLLWCGVCPLDSLTDEELAAILRKWRQARQLALPGDQIILLIERRHALVKRLDLPSHDADELRRMVELQAAGHTPYTREELVIDHLVQEKMSSGYTRLLAVMVPAVVVQRYRNVCLLAGVLPGQVTISSVGLVGWGVLTGGKNAFAVMDADAEMVETCFIRSEALVFSRQSLLDERVAGETRSRELARQYALTVAACGKEGLPDCSVRNIYCFFTGIDPVLVFGPDHVLDMTVHVAALPGKKFVASRFSWPEQVLSGEVSLAAVSGAALFPGRLPVDLVAEDQRKQALRKTARQMLWRSLLVGLAGAVSLAGVLSVPWFRQNAQLEQLNGELLRLKPEVARVKEKARQVQSLELLAYGGMRVPVALREIWDLVGKDIVLTVLDFSNAGEISMEGYSPAHEAVNLLYERLGLSPLFGDVRIEYINKRVLESGEVDYFRVSCRMKEDL
jgi:hypothetical protein